MKFEQKYPQATSTDRFEFQYSYVTKAPKLGQCQWCRSFTRWIDILFQVPVCSEECNSKMWEQYKSDEMQKSKYENFEEHFKQVKRELKIAEAARDPWKDILIVVRDQLDYFKACIESIRKTTTNYHLHIWDNGSRKETVDYIQQLVSDCLSENSHWLISTNRLDKNFGFISPNNQMASHGKNEFIILLNSDTKVFNMWDRAMTGYLDAFPKVAQVGYWGGHLEADGRGCNGSNGSQIDYIPGWCFCVKRSTYQEFGLFNPDLNFAYCEDADLSLRLKEAGHELYALHAPLVHHYQNKTIIEVEKEGEIDVRASFEQNHQYLKNRWKDYLENSRVRKDSNGS